MQQLLDPAFMNFRANTYYDTLMIKNSKTYFFKNQEGTYESIATQGYATVQAAIDAGEEVYAPIWTMWGTEGYIDAEGNECPEFVLITDETVYSIDGSGTAEADAISGAALYAGYAAYMEPGNGYDACV